MKQKKMIGGENGEGRVKMWEYAVEGIRVSTPELG